MRRTALDARMRLCHAWRGRCHLQQRAQVHLVANRINSNTPNGTMAVAVGGFPRAARATLGCGPAWCARGASTRPRRSADVAAGGEVQDTPRTGESLPAHAWWPEVPGGLLRGAENYTK